MSSQQWQNLRYVPHPCTFLNKQRWKDTSPASEPKKGEVRLREMTAQEVEQNRLRQEFIRPAKLPENLRKSEAEIWALVA